MNYHMLVLDLDGTLTNAKKEISTETKEALMKLQKQGVTLVLASGRPTFGIEPLAKELELREHGGFIVSFNGGRVIDCKENKVIFEQTIKEERIPQIVKLAKEHNVNLLTHKDNYILTNDETDTYVQIEGKINKMPVVEDKNLEQAISFPVIKFIMLGGGEYLAEVEPSVKDALGEKFSVYRSEPFFLEIMAEGIDKAQSLQRLLDYLGREKDGMVACGDGYNDISMVEFAGLGVAMKNGNDTIKEKADYVTEKTNDENGIVEVIEKFF